MSASSPPAYDVIVIGLGAIGAATLLQLARRGRRVLGIDRWNPPHAWGSTHGETRVTRVAIGEGEAYVPLVQRSHEIWRELEAETGEPLLDACGALILAPAGNAAIVHGKPGFVRATIAAAERFAIPHEVLAPEEAVRRFPQFRLQGDELVYYEPGGGYVRPEACVRVQLTLAQRLGAQIRANTQVTAVARDGSGVQVTTAGGERVAAAEVVLAAGAWSAGLCGGTLAPHLQVTRQVLHWFAPVDPAAFEPGRCPVYIWIYGNRPEEGFYGFPLLPGGDGVKVAMEQHTAFTADPDELRREVTAAEGAEMYRAHLEGRMPGLRPGPLRSVVCPYTVTPDGDFLVQRLPENERVLLVSACSGHGFKHSAGLGEAVAEMAGGGAGRLAVFAADGRAALSAERAVSVARLSSQPGRAATHEHAGR